MTTKKPIVGFSLGDVNGIGPELILKTLNNPSLMEMIIPVVYGSTRVLNYYKKLMPEITVHTQSVHEIPHQIGKQINVVNCLDDQTQITPGEINDMGGKCAALSLLAATKALKEKKIDVLITAPIHKKNIRSNAFEFVGHTPFLKHFFQVEDVLMLMVSDDMRMAVLTEHIPVKDIAQHISVSHIIKKIKILEHTLKTDFLIQRPKIAVLGLNPHCGDGGLVGREEIEVIAPAIKQLNLDKVFVFGPYSADAFFRHGHHHKFDAVLAMYHDQGLIPFKSLSHAEGVNFTAGLPVIRTSPDHGTAFNIAGKNTADIASFQQAIFMGIDIFRNRHHYQDMTQNPLKKQNVRYWAHEDEKVENITEE